MKKFFIFSLLVALFAGALAGSVLFARPAVFQAEKEAEAEEVVATAKSLEPLVVQEVAEEPATHPERALILFDVPFSPQAPFANWSDPRQNYACEETSALMAVKWAKGEELTLGEAEEAIIAAADWQLEQYGEFHDTSAQDTADRLLKGYFGYYGVELKSGITAWDIKQELWEGNIVVVPVRGRELGNPYYTPPGPLIHMVVVVGYDGDTSEFIVNDPGTRRGAQIRYHETVLENAVRDYQSGHNEPLEDSEKVMIVVSPESGT